MGLYSTGQPPGSPDCSLDLEDSLGQLHLHCLLPRVMPNPPQEGFSLGSLPLGMREYPGNKLKAPGVETWLEFLGRIGVRGNWGSTTQPHCVGRAFVGVQCSTPPPHILQKLLLLPSTILAQPERKGTVGIDLLSLGFPRLSLGDDTKCQQGKILQA